MAAVPLSPGLRMASSKPRWAMCFMNVGEVENHQAKTDKVYSGKITPLQSARRRRVLPPKASLHRNRFQKQPDPLNVDLIVHALTELVTDGAIKRTA